MCIKSPTTFPLSAVLSPIPILDVSHVRKDTRLSPPAQLQRLRSGEWEPGNEATALKYGCVRLMKLVYMGNQSLRLLSDPLKRYSTIVMSYSTAINND